MIYEFNSQIFLGPSFNKNWTQNEIKDEPMLFNNNLNNAWENGGPITKNFLSKIPAAWNSDEVIVDSRVHMLMPGWYPCIPGFHHDDVARDKTGQPNYDHQPYHAKHLMGLVNGEICPTTFALGKHKLPKVTEGTVYKKWHNIVVDQVRDGTLQSYEVPSGTMISFDWQSMHCGQKAKENGWRWFIRLTKRNHNFTNEIRRQVQTYLEFPTEGW